MEIRFLIGFSGTLVATFTSSDDGTVSWAVSGVSSSDFTMDSSSGQLTVANPPDREVNLVLVKYCLFLSLFLTLDQSNVYVNCYSNWHSDSE